MPAKFMSWLAILLCCGGVATREVAAAADKPEEEQLILLLQALRNREQVSNQLWVRFRIRTHESAAFLTLLKGVRQESDRHENLQCEYACKGAKTRSYSKNDNPADGDWMRGEYFNIYNGEISIRPSNEQKVYFLSRNPNPSRACELPSSMIGEDLLREDLEFWVAGKGKIHRIRVAEEVAEDGEPMLRLTSDWQRDIRLICWVIPSQGWTLRRFEEYIAGKPVRKHEVQEFMTSGGIYYPKRGSRSIYREDDGKVHIKTAFEVDQLETQERRIPDSLFQFEIPKGGQIWDDDLKVMIRDTELSQSHLREAINRLAPRNVWMDWLWVSLSATIVSLSLLFVYLWRRRSRKLSSVAGSVNGDKPL